MKELVADGKIVLFSSHQMSYVEEFCDDIVLINKGKIVLNGRLRDIKRSYERNDIFISVDAALGRAIDIMPSVIEKQGIKDIVQSVSHAEGGCVVKLNSESDKNALLKAIFDSDIGIEKFEVIEPSLEDIFVREVGE